jgi:hypothetical protein
LAGQPIALRVLLISSVLPVSSVAAESEGKCEPNSRIKVADYGIP